MVLYNILFPPATHTLKMKVSHRHHFLPSPRVVSARLAFPSPYQDASVLTTSDFTLYLWFCLFHAHRDFLINMATSLLQPFTYIVTSLVIFFCVCKHKVFFVCVPLSCLRYYIYKKYEKFITASHGTRPQLKPQSSEILLLFVLFLILFTHL